VAKLSPIFADPHVVAQIGLYPWLQPKNQAYPENGYIPLPAVFHCVSLGIFVRAGIALKGSHIL